MCLSTVFLEKDGNKREILMEKVASFNTEGSRLTFTDLFGSSKTFTGCIKSADLLENCIVITNLEN